jgi:hypothetical protein
MLVNKMPECGKHTRNLRLFAGDSLIPDRVRQMLHTTDMVGSRFLSCFFKAYEISVAFVIYIMREGHNAGGTTTGS